ncbi:NAD(P)/FAD-dependent oxidoreductase [Aspergillus stella-maris]|uniref:NAD(P)/FAD-dependent oxidoreductase n=1 Tax=Aspergillus stella-maris TaxID=1810926 RepID=UPI003CCCAE9F
MTEQKQKSIAIIGAGIFGLSLALSLRDRNYAVTVFDRAQYDQNGYDPAAKDVQAASVDHNKIFRASYGTKLHYQRLAMESRKAWVAEDERRGFRSTGNDWDEDRLFVNSGMLRVQPSDELSALERETLENMARDGLRDTQFVKSDQGDWERAEERGWKGKLLEFGIPGSNPHATYEAVLDSTAGFVRFSRACAYYQEVAVERGVVFRFGPEEGCVEELVKSDVKDDSSRERVTGMKTKDGKIHYADVVVVAAGSFSTQILPDLSYHLESSAGSVAAFKIDPANKELWDKYSPERFPVMTWKSVPRDSSGKDTGSIYVLPRTPEGLVKIGYRGIKFTNFQPAPINIPFTQDGQWSVPLPLSECKKLQESAVYAITQFVSIFLPDFKDTPFHFTKLCWYTDSLDNSFVIDYVPTYADNSVFVCTGGSGHGAKFVPILGQHAADILEHGHGSTSYMRPFWRWRPDAPRRNGLEEGPGGPRDIGHHF